MAGGIKIASLFASIGADTSGFVGGMSKTKGSLKGLASDFADFSVGVNQALEIATKVAQAMEQAYAALKEGAALEYADTRFKNLAESIGTTAYVLKNDMREATHGMMSDSELAASGADIMALGLAKDHDAVVRLSSVAGALSMDMNELVLTLTNQTTRRFDQLGVSVDGFDERVEKLKATGMSANDAFNEAFLQQAEAQIERVGSASDETIGDFKRLEAAQKTYMDGLKKDLAENAGWWTDFWTAVFNEGSERRNNRDVVAQMRELGILTETQTALLDNQTASYGTLSAGTKHFLEMSPEVMEMWDHYNTLITDYAMNAEDAAERTKYLYETFGIAAFADKTSDWADANYDLGYSYSDAAEEAGNLADEVESLALLSEENIEFQVKLSGATALTDNFTSIIGLAKNYDDIMGEMADISDERGRLLAGGISPMSAEVTGLNDKLRGLQDKMSDLANQMTLDMFQAAIVVGGVTDAEAAAYFQMAADMGIISQNASAAAILAYGNASATIGDMSFDAEGNITLDPEEALATIKMIEAIQIADLTGNINMTVRYYGTSGNFDPYEPGSGYTPPGGATGGYISQGGLITVGENGPELVYLPDNAQIIPHGRTNETIREISEGSAGEGGNTYNYYTLTMPTTSNPADVRTAFELMEAWT